MRQADKLGYNEREGLSRPSTERATKFHLKQVHVEGGGSEVGDRKKSWRRAVLGDRESHVNATMWDSDHIQRQLAGVFNQNSATCLSKRKDGTQAIQPKRRQKMKKIFNK